MRTATTVSSHARPDTCYRRALIISTILGIWMLAIGARLVYVQTTQHDWLNKKARAQQREALDTGACRGLILDRNGLELARSISTDSFFVQPDELGDIDCAAGILAPILNEDVARVRTQLREANSRGSRFMWLARKVDEELSRRIKGLAMKGVYFHQEPKRFYPNGQLAAHVLGFVGLDELGLGGIEQFYNEKIRGEAGKLFVETDARRRRYESFESMPHPGQSVILTIDELFQNRTEEALASAVQNTHAKSGTAIVLDPRTGEILALANAPSFDPNNAHSVSPQLRLDGALQNVYEPGSTFKIVAYSAAIEKGLVKPEDRIDCQMGSITVAGRLVHDHHPFGSLTIAQALAKSSNVAAIKLGLRVGDSSMYDFMTRFGFGKRTGIELPGETPGILRPVNKWQPSSIGSIAMGQEIGVTPLQMASAFASVANDGVHVAPHLVREIRAEDGSILFHSNPEQRRVVSVETAKAIRGMLEGVTVNGTAKRAQLDGYSAAGKTGTAQKIDPKTHSYSRTKYVGSFVGFAPVENPSIVIIVVIDEPVGSYHGGDIAAPVFREIAEQILPDLNVATDIDTKPAPQMRAMGSQHAYGLEKMRDEIERSLEEKEATLPRVARDDPNDCSGEIVYAPASDGAVLMPDFRGRSLRDAAIVCSRLDLRLDARGEGRSLRQNPAPGAELLPGQTVTIEFDRDY